MSSGSLNKAILIGHLGKDVEVGYTPQGEAAATISVATNERWKDKAGKLQERTEWHRVQLWGDTAINAGKYLRKGSMVYVEGRIHTREYTDKTGAKRWSTEIKSDRLTYLDPKDSSRQQEREAAPAPEPAAAPAGGDDDLLF